MSLRKITESDLQGYGVVGMEDTPNLSARAMQEKVEEVVRKVVIPAINENVDKTVSKQDLADAIFNAGAGDMQAVSYDSNLDGIVNRADNGFFTYTHSKVDNIHYLYGNGSNVKFASVADFEDGDVFMIGDQYYPAFLVNGEVLPDGHFKADMTVTCFIHGNCLNFNSGGAGVNFKVVGGTTQPASPKENTIWINTDIEITMWAMDSAEPDYLAYGGVWIETATEGNTVFNGLKGKNRLYVAPKKAYQWNGEQFAEKEILVYTDGEWKTAEEVLFPYSLTFVTGGASSSNCKVTDTYLYVYCGPSATNGNCHSQTTIDCSKYTKLKFTVSSVKLSGNATATVGVHSTGSGTTSGGYTAYAKVTAAGDYEVDIADISEALYVTVSVWSSDANPNMTVTNITAI